MAEETCGDHQAVSVAMGTADPSEQGGVVRGSRAGAGGCFKEFQFRNCGDQGLGIPQQLVDAAGRDRVGRR
ncbi:hypothetical protein D3C73_1532770 [compost metagenome]